MNQWLRQFTERDRLFSGIVAVLLMTCLLSAIVGGLIGRDGGQEQPQDQTNPTLIDVTPSGDRMVTSDQPVIYSGGEGAAGQAQLRISLGEGQAQPQAVDSLQVVSGEPLSEEAIARILARLPQLTPLPEDTVEFNLPEEVLPPPRPGQTVEEPFPPPEAPSTSEPVATGPLEVLRYGPEGEVPIAPTINVTFNQPMVPLATLEALAAEEVPIQVEPALPGTWKWLGTKTLSFEFESDLIDRLPMATEYRVTIPAGTTSATGGRLADTVSWTFTTPPPQVTAFHPQSSPQPLNPLFFVAFDQRVDSESVLNTIQVTADGQTMPIVLATAAEIEADETVSAMAETAPAERWLAFKSQSPLPADAAIAISIGPGTPSAEGPLVTETAQRFDFRTYSPLRVERHGCSWSPDQCPPLTPLYIEFNNPIDVEAYDESMLRIEPALPGATINIFGQTINIQGATEGRTTYRVTLDSAIQDIFGQKLGQDTVL
ncbi:MAG: Ig-like domain-containing protein, partial [Candidatus Promineifilaceae bacterium]